MQLDDFSTDMHRFFKKPYQTTVCKLQLQIKTSGHAELPHGVDIGILLMFLPNFPQQRRCLAFRLTIFWFS